MAEQTLSQKLSAWRNENQGGTGHAGLLSKLTIDGSLYDVKDPSVEYLAQEIETRLSTVESKSWTPVTKASGSGVFASEVTQDATGQIAVTYSNIRQSALNDAAVSGQFITDVSQGVDGQVTIHRGSVDADKVVLASTLTTETDVKGAIEELIGKYADMLGESTDTYSQLTLYGVKAYADYVVNNLAGADWEANARKVQEIIAELENSDNANAWSTAIDKLAGLGVKTPAVYYTQAECDEYNTANSLNPDDDGYRTTSDVKTAAVYNTVKDYVDTTLAASVQSINDGIAALDANIYAGSNGNSDSTTADNSYTNDTTSQVAVKITEENGKITGVSVKTNDIASAATVSALSTNKADKADFVQGTVTQWANSYASETLTWTSSQVTVWKPAV